MKTVNKSSFSLSELKTKLKVYIVKKIQEFTEKRISYLLKNKIKTDYQPNQYKYFNNLSEIKLWCKVFDVYFEKTSKEYYNNLISAEKVTTSQDALQLYAGYVAECINRHLRNREKLVLDFTFNKEIEVISKEINKNTIEDNIVVLRLIHTRFLSKNIKKGMILKDKAFLSTTLNLNHRKNSEGEDLRITNVGLIFIKIPKGAKALYLEGISKKEEFEILLPQNTELLVEAAHKIFSNSVLFTKVVNHG